MKVFPVAVVLTLSLVAFGAIPAHAQAPSNYVTFISGDQEVPPVETNAIAFAIFSFTPNDELLIGWRLNLGHDQMVTDIHFHQAPVGVDGPIITNLRVSPNPFGAPGALCIDLFGGLLTYYLVTADALTGPLAGLSLTRLRVLMGGGDTYINLHTPQNPGGWIRGQMIPVGP